MSILVMFLLIACQTVSSVELKEEQPEVSYEVELSALEMLLKNDPELEGKYFKVLKKIFCINKDLLQYRLTEWAGEVPSAIWYQETEGGLDPYVAFINKETKTISVLEYIVNNGEETIPNSEIGVYACILSSGSKLIINNKTQTFGTSFELKN